MSNKRVTKNIAAIMAVDMVDYLRLMQMDEAGIVARQKACIDELINPKIEENSGHLVKTTCDSFLVEFSSAVDAVLCSETIQREMINREADIAEDRRIQYRVGINFGEIIIEDDEISGDAVDVAARLAALSEPGGISISEAVFANVKGKLDLGFSDLGAQKVENIAEPIPVFQVLLDPEDKGKFIAAKSDFSIGKYNIAAMVLLVVVLFAVGQYFAFDGSPPT